MFVVAACDYAAAAVAANAVFVVSVRLLFAWPPALGFRIVSCDLHDQCNRCHKGNLLFFPSHRAAHLLCNLPATFFDIWTVWGQANAMCLCCDWNCKIVKSIKNN